MADATLNTYDHGFRKLAIAFYKTHGTDSTDPTFDTPIDIPGDIKFGASDGSSTKKYYASDVTHMKVHGAKDITGSIDLYGELPVEFQKRALGRVVDANGHVNIIDGGKREPFAVLYQTQGDVEATDHVWYNAEVSKEIDVSEATDEAEVTPNTHTIPLSFAGENFSGTSRIKCSVKKSESTTDFASFFTAVYIPKAATTVGD